MFISTHARFSTSSNGAASHRSHEPLSDEMLRRIAPSIFADTAHDSRSDRYGYIPTSAIVAGMRSEGFHPFFVAQGGSRDEGKRAHTKHMIRFRHQSTVGTVGTFNEIVLINSHDGTSAYKLQAGCFRLVCLNGMIAGTMIDEVRIPHIKQAVGRVVEGAHQILSKLPEVSETVREWSHLRLSPGEQAAFATAAHTLRYDEPEKAPIAATKLLNINRRDDADPTLWNTLNTLQENIIQGGIRYVQRNDRGLVEARRRTRPVKGIDQNVQLNRGLWTLAQEMAKLKA